MTETLILRSRLGLSINDFAALLDVDRDTLGKWDRGERRPNAAARRLLRTLAWLHDRGLLDEYRSAIEKAPDLEGDGRIDIGTGP